MYPSINTIALHDGRQISAREKWSVRGVGSLARSYWGHRLGVSDGLLQVLGHSVRVKTQEVQGHQLQGPEHHVGVPVYWLFPYSNIEVI